MKYIHSHHDIETLSGLSFADFANRYNELSVWFGLSELDYIGYNLFDLYYEFTRLKNIINENSNFVREHDLDFTDVVACIRANGLVDYERNIDELYLDEYPEITKGALPLHFEGKDNYELAEDAIENILEYGRKITFLRRALEKIGFTCLYNTLEPSVTFVRSNVNDMTHHLSTGLDDPEYTKMFSSFTAYKIFIELHNAYFKDEKKHLANYSFIYWKMYGKNGLMIHKKPSEFAKYISEKFNVNMPYPYRLKKLEACTTKSKEAFYEIVVKSLQG